MHKNKQNLNKKLSNKEIKECRSHSQHPCCLGVSFPFLTLHHPLSKMLKVVLGKRTKLGEAGIVQGGLDRADRYHVLYLISCVSA